MVNNAHAISFVAKLARTAAAFSALLVLVPWSATLAHQAAAANGQATVPSGTVTMAVNPGRVCHNERRPAYLNFDLIIGNGTDKELKVQELRGSVFNEKGEMVERRWIAPRQNPVGLNTTIPAGREGLIFNPLLFASMKPGLRLRYQVEFEGGEVEPIFVDVTPQSCVTRARLVLPLTGRVLVSDGYDLFSHHRRMGYVEPGARRLGLTDNFQRFGMDLVMVDAQGRQHTGDGKRNEDYFSWGKPVRAAGAGTVAAVHNEQPDNEPGSENRWVQRKLSQNQMTTYGNYVLIDHGGGEFSLTGHLRAGSVRVRKGDRVEAGDVIAQVGNSGSSMGVHVHYELRNGWGVRGIQTMPPYFRDVTVLGTGERRRQGVAVDTGDVLLAR